MAVGNEEYLLKYSDSAATCSVTDFSRDPPQTAFCLQDGELIVMTGSRVVGWCDVGIKPVTRIELLYTYQPLCKHYVLQSGSEVKVVAQNKHLEINHSYEDVRKFEVSDFTGVGYPQLGLWRNDEEEPIVIDFSRSLSVPSENPVSRLLSTKLQGLKMSVEKTRRQLEEKKRVRRLQAFLLASSSSSEPRAAPQPAPLVRLIGPEPLPNEAARTRKKNEALSIRNTWQRLHCGEWVIGVEVYNKGDGPLTRISMCAGNQAMQCRVLVAEDVSADPTTPSWCSWRTLLAGESLAPGRTASVVGSVAEPLFSGEKPFVELSALLRAKLSDGKEVTASVPRWRLDARDVLSGRLQPFSTPPSAADALTCLSTSVVKMKLLMAGPRGLRDRVVGILGSVSVEPPPGVAPGRDVSLLVGAGTQAAPLRGALLTLSATSATSCELGMHLRDPRHALLLVHTLLSALPQHTRVRVDGADDDIKDVEELRRAMMEALGNELRAVCDFATSLSSDALGKLREQQKITDLAAAKLRKVT